MFNIDPRLEAGTSLTKKGLVHQPEEVGALGD